MRSNRCLRVCLCLGLGVALAGPGAGCKGDPNSIKDQVKVLKDKGASTSEKLKAVENLRKLGKVEAVPGLCDGLKTSPPKVKAEIAVVLGELGDTAAMMPLANAIDLEPKGGEKGRKEADAANEKIARALGDLGGKGATPQLLKLLSATTSGYVKFEVLNALGKIADPAAAPVLLDLALNESVEQPINKKSMAALAMIAPPEALPVFMKGLIWERGTLSLYPDASFGLFRMRAGATDAVLALLNGRDKELLQWARAREIPPAALVAKGAQLAGDLRDPRFVPVLLRHLKYRDEVPEMALLVQVAAAESLGRMRARAAVPPLLELLKGEDRDPFALALVRIGDRSVLPRFVACATSGGWNARLACLQGVVALGGKSEARLFDAAIKDEPRAFMAECRENANDVVNCDKEKDRIVEEHVKALTAYKKALETVAACADTGCLSDALGSDDPVVREKACYTAVQKGDLEAVPALIGAIKRPAKEPGDLVARTAAILATDWLIGTNPEARAKVRGEVKALKAQVEQDARVGATAESAEEIKRLIDVIERGREADPAAAAPAGDDSGEEKKAPARPAARPAKKKGGKKGPVKPLLVKVVAAISILAGIGVLAIEIPRFRSGASIEIWLWGLIALGAIAFGAYELIAGGAETKGPD